MRVRDLVGDGRKVITTEPAAPLSEALALMIGHGIGALPVIGPDGVPAGIIAERDIVRALHEHGAAVHAMAVNRVMRRPPPTCDVEDTLLEVTSRMTRERARHLVVLSDGRLEGVLSVGDLVKHRLRQLETEAGVLRDTLAGQRARF